MGLCPLDILCVLEVGNSFIAKPQVIDKPPVDKPVRSDMGSLTPADIVK